MERWKKTEKEEEVKEQGDEDGEVAFTAQ